MYHEGTNEELIGQSSIIGDKSNISELPNRAKSLVHNLTAIGLKSDSTLNSVQNSLRISESSGVDTAINTLRLELVDLILDLRRLIKIYNIAAKTLGYSKALLNVINDDNATSSCQLRPL